MNDRNVIVDSDELIDDLVDESDADEDDNVPRALSRSSQARRKRA